MSCLNQSIQLVPPVRQEIIPVAPVDMQVGLVPQGSLEVAVCDTGKLTVSDISHVDLSVELTGTVKMTIGEVCSVSSGTIVILAASDGPLRTKNGGYILLNPETN